MKTLISVIALLAVVLVGDYYLSLRDTGPDTVPVVVAKDYKNITYTIDGTAVLLQDGLSVTPTAPGAVAETVTQYFGNEAYGDLNSDGTEDVAFLLTQNTGGSGTFFYVAAALNTPQGYHGTEALLLGDRIAPQSTEYRNGGIVVNYAIRKADEPMSASPSVGVSKYFKIRNGELVEVALDFEGEADPARMSLTMKPWVWMHAEYQDGRRVTPTRPGAFAISFTDDNRFSVTTDCNSAGGAYRAQGDTIVFTDIMSTLMYCEGSQEQEFIELLSNTSSFHFTGKGELILNLKFDSGSVVFK